ncbi:PAS domain S-box protein [Lutibacter sp.]|uniref:PAS domain S-box protein n=1 Tax=Lutibacter sp. TaxID=1925666 RepID=UPI0035646402
MLLIILAIDAFRSFFESVYFGFWYTSYAGLIPIEVFNFLAQPEIVFFPKLFNLLVATLILLLIVRKWLPADQAQKKKTDDLLEKQSYEIKRLLAAVEQSANTIVITDINGLIEYTNPKFTEVTNYTAAEVKGKNPRILNSGNQSKAFYSTMWKTISAGNVWKGEFKNKSKFGKLFWEQVTISPIKNDDGEIINYLAIKEDISALKESEERLKTLINASPDAIFFKDGEGKWEEINKAGLALFNLTNTDYKGKTDKEIYASQAFLEEALLISEKSNDEAWEKKQTIQLEEVLQTPEGKDIFLDVIKVPLFNSDATRKGLVIIKRDITSKKEDQIKLQEQQSLFETMFNSIADGIVITNTEREIILANKGMQTTFGYLPNELIGEKTAIFYADEEKYKNAGNTIFSNKSKPSDKLYVTYYKNKRGAIFPGETFGTKLFDAKGVWIGNLGIMRNISERFKSQETLQQSADMIASSSDMMALLDENFTYILVNESYAKAFGESPKQIIGKNAADILGEDIFIKTIKPNALKCIIENRSINYQEWFHLPVLGTCFMDINYYPFYSENKKIKGFIVNGRDITVQKNSETDLIKAKEKAEESDQLKTEFLSNMSHEIRTPMNGILGFSDMLNNPELTTEKRANFIKIIQSSSKQLLHIIDDILEISRLETKQVSIDESEVCLNDVLLELFSVFDLKAKENKTPLYLKKELSNEQSTIITDKTKLNKVLSNLLENALKFTNEGFIELGYVLNNKNLEIYVKDTGIGIDAEKHESIFDRFSQAERDLSKKTGGLGLGLSIVKENTALLGGKIALDSIKGKGATFTIIFPYKPIYQTKIEAKNENKPLILIAEDEEVNYIYLETLIKDIIKLECNLIHVKNGLEALQACEEFSNIDLVFMDLKMPVMNGFEATKKLRKLYPTMPIVAQTAYSTASEKEQALYAGCTEFLIKPISKKVFVDVIGLYLTNKL